MANIEPVELLRRQYLQNLDPAHLTLPEKAVLRLPHIQKQIYDGMFNKSMVKYPPPERYQFRVLKKIIVALEDAIDDPDEDEISDELSICLADYMSRSFPPGSSAAQEKGYLTYTAPSLSPSSFEVTLLEAPSLLASSGTTGFRTWEAALQLGAFFCSSSGKHYLYGQSVLELGAGTGLLSILCAKHLGASHVLATDGSQEVINDMKTNVTLNDIAEDQSIEVVQLQWGHSLIGGVADPADKGSKYDLAFGADVTYDLKTMPALVATLRDIFELHPGIRILISATVRNKDTVACFLQACDENGFAVNKLDWLVPKYEEQTGFFLVSTPTITIFEIRSPRKPRDAFAI